MIVRQFFSTEENQGIAKNLTYAMLSQGIGLASSLVMSLVVPKVLGVEDYAYWQLFMLYTTYSGLALFGVNDGIYLRLGGKRYSELDFPALKAQIVLISVFQIVIGIVCVSILMFLPMENMRRFVFIFVAIYGLVANLTSCMRYIFQSTNLTQISSIADLVARISYLGCVAVILFCGGSIAAPFIILYTICQALSLAYISICARSILQAKSNRHGALRACLADAGAGIKITVAYYADSLIVGITRMMTDWHLGLVTFGKVSFSFSMTNFVLVFIGQVAMVLFPILKRLDSRQQCSMYVELRAILNTLLPISYLLYVPMRLVLGLWLPQYYESLVYLALTMPLCIYACKANFLFNTYFKMLRCETALCMINIATMLLNLLLSAISILAFGSIELACVGIFISVAARDVAFEAYLAKRFNVKYAKQIASLAILSSSFMGVSWLMGIASWPVVGILTIAYLLINRETTTIVYNDIQKRLSR
jgi:O-antigen/teichoic acid export membrane protein